MRSTLQTLCVRWGLKQGCVSETGNPTTEIKDPEGMANVETNFATKVPPSHALAKGQYIVYI